MSIGPSGGIVPSAAGSPLAQTSGADAARAKQTAAAQARQQTTAKQASMVEGVARTSEHDSGPGDCDADGRHAGEFKGANADDSKQPQASPDGTDRLLDLSG